MQVMEFSKGATYALTVSVAPGSADAFAQEMRQVKAALLDWKAKRQDQCEMVMFTVVSAPEHYPAIESLLASVYSEEAELSPLLQSMDVQVALLSPRGKPVKEYSLGQPAARAATEPKPWWKLW